jgi:sigma-B regulation protein RsbU (phosphoserine phosphatase)
MDDKTVKNMPIGILDDGKYRSSKVRLKVNDLVLTYTDALSEATGADGKLLGTQGVCDIVNSLDSVPPEALIPELLTAIRRLNSDNLTSDDTTVMLLRANGSGVPFMENLKAPFRMLKGLFSSRLRAF